MADEIKMPVEATHIMMFARAVGDDNPIYRDGDYAGKTEVGHIIAPPTFPPPRLRSSTRTIAYGSSRARNGSARARTRPGWTVRRRAAADCTPSSISNTTGT